MANAPGPPPLDPNDPGDAWQIVLGQLLSGKADAERVQRLEDAIHNQYAGGPGIGPRIVTLQEAMKSKLGAILTDVGDFFARLFRLGDKSRRPWVWVVLLLAFGLSLGAWFARKTYYSTEAREERREQMRADSLREARAHELEMLRLHREIEEERAEHAQPRPPSELSVDELDVEAEAVTVTPSNEPTP